MRTTHSIHRSISQRIQKLTFLMTEFCNLRCIYCYEHEKSDKTVLPLNVAQREIRRAFDDERFDVVQIEFFGGEPIAAFRAIKNICEWVWQNEWPKPYTFFATTNGTLVHGKIAEWFRANNKKFTLCLSLDGTPTMHDRNRSNSFDRIDVGYFKELWPQQTVKMTISKGTISKTFDGIVYIHHLGLSPNACIAGGSDWFENEYAAFSIEMRKLADYYLEHPDLYPSNLIAVSLNRISLQSTRDDDDVDNCCGTGANMKCIDRTGASYPCQMFMPMVNPNAADIEHISKTLSTAKNRADPECRVCRLLPSCQTCYGQNLIVNGSPFIREKHDCVFFKLRAKAAAYLFGEMILNGYDKYAFFCGRDESFIFHFAKGVEIVASLPWDERGLSKAALRAP